MAARPRRRPDLGDGEGERWPWARPGSGASLPRAAGRGLVDCVVVGGGIGRLCIAARSPFLGIAFAESKSGARLESASEDGGRFAAMAVSETTALHFSSPSMSLSARVHPLMIFNICDCYVRRPDQAVRVIGTLLGSVLPDGTVDIRNSYAVPHNEFSGQPSDGISKVVFGGPSDCREI